jgi:hypothetical protein
MDGKHRHQEFVVLGKRISALEGKLRGHKATRKKRVPKRTRKTSKR